MLLLLFLSRSAANFLNFLHFLQDQILIFYVDWLQCKFYVYSLSLSLSLSLMKQFRIK